MDSALELLGPISLRSDRVEVTVLSKKGADIVALRDLRSGVDVLFKTPWQLREPGLFGSASSSFERWIEAYPGGWQLLLPNGGDECTENGVTWGFHGEAALVPWRTVDRAVDSAVLETRLMTAPLRVRREVAVAGPVLRITETVANESPVDVEVMWSHHPAFGPPFLDSSCVLSAGCQTFLADDRAPGTVVAAGTRHGWPVVTAADGTTVDLSRIPSPDEPRAILGYLCDFGSGFCAVTSGRLGLGVGLRWPLQTFGHAWLWQEMRSTREWPWFRRAYVLAVEPASTIPGQGLANARAKGHSGVLIGAGSARTVVIEAVLFEGRGPVKDISEGGDVQFG